MIFTRNRQYFWWNQVSPRAESEHISEKMCLKKSDEKMMKTDKNHMTYYQTKTQSKKMTLLKEKMTDQNKK